MIDTNVSLFRWPFRRVIGDDTEGLVTRLRNKGVTQAWVGSFESLQCRDVAGVNFRLAAACRTHGPNFLIPFGCINPKSSDWEEDLRRCHETYHMVGIRLYPNYHGYTLGDPALAKLLSIATDRNLVVQIALSMEDPRTQFPRMLVRPVDPAPLADLVPRFPRLDLILLNAGTWVENSKDPTLQRIKKTNNIYFDIAMNEGIGAVADRIAATSSARVVFGSHYPFFYFESSLLKVRSAGLSGDQERAVYGRNAQSLLSRLS